MTHAFDKAYWERHWHGDEDGGAGSMASNPPNPHLVREIGGLAPGTALDAGCGAGAEAIWLAQQGWEVTAADISAEALTHAAERAARSEVPDRVRWVEADLAVWEPGAEFDLVTTHYAHPAMPQLAFYDRLASWVAPGGTLLIVGHLHPGDDAHGHEDEHGHGHGHRPPAEASVTAAAVAARLDDANWRMVTEEEHHRILEGEDGQDISLHDVVVRAVRRPVAQAGP